MNWEQHLTAARDQAVWFAGTINEAVSGYIIGGWQGVVSFALAILVMFLLTSLIAPKR